MDLSTTYLGLDLRSPLVPSAAAPLTDNLDTIKRLEDAGAGAIVLHSLFEEQLHREPFELRHHRARGAERVAAARDDFSADDFSADSDEFYVAPERYLEHIARARDAVAVPVIASLNGFSRGGWLEYARLLEEAGAEAIELNVYFVPANPDLPGTHIEQLYLDALREVKAEVSIPVAMKLSPFFSNIAYTVKQLTVAGADGLVLFDRFLQPEIDPKALEVSPQPHLSHSVDALLAIRWIALLYGRVPADFAATGGIQTGRDAIKALMAGAKVTHLCSTLLRHGIEHLCEIERQLQSWMAERDYESVRQIQGTMSQVNCSDPSVYERAQYTRLLQVCRPQWRAPSESPRDRRP